jgi:hypothetical protein
MDLLDETAMKRAMGEAAAGSRGGFNSSRARETDDFDMEDGKLVIKELKDRKRGRGYDDEDEGGAGGGSDDAADDDRRSRGGKSMGGKSMGGKSMGGKSMGGKSAGGKSAGGRSSVGGKSAAGGSTRGDASAAGGKRRKVERHAKEAFKPKKKGTGGDLKVRTHAPCFFPLRGNQSPQHQKAGVSEAAVSLLVVGAERTALSVFKKGACNTTTADSNAWPRANPWVRVRANGVRVSVFRRAGWNESGDRADDVQPWLVMASFDPWFIGGCTRLRGSELSHGRACGALDGADGGHQGGAVRLLAVRRQDDEPACH